jgi:hypothetical protein
LQLSAKLKAKEFYNFVVEHRDNIEFRPTTNLSLEDYLKQKFKVENLNADVQLITPIETIKMGKDYIEKLLRHKNDKTRAGFLLDGLTTLERPNIIIEAIEDNGKKTHYYIKLFADKDLNTHLSIVSPKPEGIFYNTHHRIDGNDIFKKYTGAVIYSDT